MVPPFHPAKCPAAVAVLLALVWSAPAASQPRDPAAAPQCSARPFVFGCANAANLVEMASPADLEVGRPLSAADGALEAAAVARLRADKVKDLRREGTDSAGGGPK